MIATHRHARAIVAANVAAIVMAAATPTFAATITFSTDFESPTYAPGPVLTQDPRFAVGQGGWGGYNAGEISTDFAHSGTQSLKTTWVPGGQSPNHALDASGSFPSYPEFVIGYANDWWVQAWARITGGGGGVAMSLGNAFGSCPLVTISGSGLPYYNPCTRQDNTEASLGSAALDQWVLLRMTHTAAMGQAMDFSVIGGNWNFTVTLDQYTGPGSANPTVVSLFGDAYWDDVSAGYGAAPAVVPLPGAVWLLASSLGVLGARFRRRSA